MSKFLFALVLGLTVSKAFATETLQLQNLKCVAANGAHITTLARLPGDEFLLVTSEIGFMRRNFKATVKNGLNGTTLIVLTGRLMTYQIAVNVNQRSTAPQTATGNLVLPNLAFPTVAPLFLSRITCDVLFK